MSVLILVRHGKAADFMTGDYDRLSQIGERQARLLGEHWANWGQKLDAVYVGPLRRHRETMKVVEQVYLQRGLPWPEPTELPGLSEHAGLVIFQHVLPSLMEQDEQIREVFEAHKRGERGDAKVGLRAFINSMKMWVREEIDPPEEAGPFSDFVARVRDTLQTIREQQGHGKQIAVFTSAGTIGAAIGLCYGLDAEVMMDLSWQLMNASLSEVVFGKDHDQMAMKSFNRLPHIDNPELVTKV